MDNQKTEVNSVHENFVVGDSYTREYVSEVTKKPQIRSYASGIHYVGNTTVLFVTLDKSGTDFDYQDEFVSPGFFNWDSQNDQTQTQNAIKKIINGDVEVILFCRLSTKIGKEVRPYTYCGRLSRSGHSSDQPVKFTFKSLDYVYDAQGDLAELYAWRLPDQEQEVA